MLHKKVSSQKYGAVLIAVAGLSFAPHALGQGESKIVETSGVHKHKTWEFDLGAIKGDTEWTGKAWAHAIADLQSGGADQKKGTKLAFDGDTSSFSPMTVTATNSANGPLGSFALGTTAVTGGATFANNKLSGTASSQFITSLTPANKEGAQALYFGDAWDPFAYGDGGFAPIEGDAIMGLGLELPAGSLNISGGDEYDTWDWTTTYSAWIRDDVAWDPDVFFGDDEAQLLYSVTFGQDLDGWNIDVLLGDPLGMSLTFSDSAENYESMLRTALSSGLEDPLTVLDGALDVSGNDSITIGYYDNIFVEAFGVPSPGVFALTGVALLCGVRRRR